MGGCRCTYRNCSLRTDGKTHMFHYPVFDKVRCHQWLTNAHKLEFLNLKVSQLKNRVVCQHHFKDDSFMNFKKDKLTFDAVPTEDGPYCDSSQLDETKTEEEESKVFSISLDDIENEYLTIVDKKANFSVKYGDFLTNCDLMDLDSLNSLNQINDNNQIVSKGLCELVANPTIRKENIPSKIPFKSMQPLTRRNRGKHFGNSSHSTFENTTSKKDTIIQGDLRINHDNTVDISKLVEVSQTEENQNSLNFILNVSHVPIEFEGKKSSDKIQENIDQSKLLNNQLIDVKVLDQSKLLNDQIIDVKVPDQSKLLNDQLIDVKVLHQSKILNDQLIDAKVLNQSKLINDQLIGVKELDQSKLLNDQPHDVKAFNETKLPNNNAARSFEKKKIRIISEKKISEPVSLIGRLKPVSPTRILTFPNKRRFFRPIPVEKNPEIPIIDSTLETSHIAMDTTLKDNNNSEKSESEPMNIICSRRDNVSPQEIRNVINVIHPTEVLPNKVSQETLSDEINKNPVKILPKTSLLKNNIPPERVAAIAEKRKFNMKLRDIIENCLDKLDKPDKIDKSDFDKRKLSHKIKIMPSNKQHVGSYLAKDPELPSVQDYTIAYLEARMKKMEDNLLNKIEENSQKIVDLKKTVATSCDKKTVHTQTSVSEEVHKKQLYQELSKYLSQEANSLLYEELFINKYIKDVPKSSSPKRRKRR